MTVRPSEHFLKESAGVYELPLVSISTALIIASALVKPFLTVFAKLEKSVAMSSPSVLAGIGIAEVRVANAATARRMERKENILYKRMCGSV